MLQKVHTSAGPPASCVVCHVADVCMLGFMPCTATSKSLRSKAAALCGFPHGGLRPLPLSLTGRRLGCTFNAACQRLSLGRLLLILLPLFGSPCAWHTFAKTLASVVQADSTGFLCPAYHTCRRSRQTLATCPQHNHGFLVRAVLLCIFRIMPPSVPKLRGVRSFEESKTLRLCSALQGGC